MSVSHLLVRARAAGVELRPTVAAKWPSGERDPELDAELRAHTRELAVELLDAGGDTSEAADDVLALVRARIAELGLDVESESASGLARRHGASEKTTEDHRAALLDSLAYGAVELVRARRDALREIEIDLHEPLRRAHGEED